MEERHDCCVSLVCQGRFPFFLELLPLKCRYFVLDDRRIIQIYVKRKG
jgi:hypothetical protein